MEVSSALRRIKRQFGDEYNVVLIDQDAYDWIHDAELDIIRATSDNDLTIPIPASSFPINIPDRISVKRVSKNGKALVNTSLSQLDLAGSSSTSQGGANYWYYQGGMVYLWPSSETTDTSSYDVTYIRTPEQMTVVAPYLAYNLNSTAIQVGQVPSDDDWKLSTSINLNIDLAIDALSNDFTIMSCGADVGTVNNHFYLGFKSPKSFTFGVSDGTITSSHILDMASPFAAGEVLSLHFVFDNTTDTAYLYKVNGYTGQEALQDMDTTNQVRNKQTTQSADLFFGNTNLVAVPANKPAMRISSVSMRKTSNPSSPYVFIMNGMDDIGGLVAVQPSFVTSSAHTMTTQGGVIVTAHNEFTVPEVYHEDIVKYCLARAHSKNQNFRAAEAEMEQYDRRVSTRRNEAQAPETALYKIADPMDYVDYGDF